MANTARPTIELRGAAFQNKGAELMLRTAAHEMRRRFPDARLAMNYLLGTPAQRRELGVDDVVWLPAHRVGAVRRAHNALAARAAAGRSRPGAPTVPPPSGGPLGRMVSRVLAGREAAYEQALVPSEVDVVLDLSGFAYGDPWGAPKALAAADYHAEIQRAGGRVVLCPQQLGPFEDPETRKAFETLSRSADRIYARERVSFEVAGAVVADPSVLRQAPDFTVEAPPREVPPGLVGRAVVVPNTKMTTQTAPEVAAAYPDFLVRVLRLLAEKGTRPYVLVHDTTGRDLRLAESLKVQIPDLEIAEEPDPFAVKAIIGAARATVGSRFHGLVNALSQAVPSLGTSWSHKYRMLFEEYGDPQSLVAVTATDAELSAALDRLLEEPTRSEITDALRAGERRRKAAVAEMWDDVETITRAVVAERA